MHGPRSKRWSPYAVGVGIGVLSWFAFATVHRGLGVSTTFEHGLAFVQRAIAPDAAATREYFESQHPTVGWEWMLVLGVLAGSFLSARIAGDRGAGPLVPPIWARRFGTSVAIRLLGAFLGGCLLMVGARLARGCTSGRGITGALQLAVSSWVFIVLAFGVGTVTAITLFGRRKEIRDV